MLKDFKIHKTDKEYSLGKLKSTPSAGKANLYPYFYLQLIFFIC